MLHNNRRIAICMFLLLLALPMLAGFGTGMNIPNPPRPSPQSPYIIVGTVTWSDGTPVDGAVVYINTSSGESIRLVTEEDGRYAAGLSTYSRGETVHISAVKDGKSISVDHLLSFGDHGSQATVPDVVDLELPGRQGWVLFLAIAVIISILLVALLFLKKKDLEEEDTKTNKSKKPMDSKEKRGKRRG